MSAPYNEHSDRYGRYFSPVVRAVVEHYRAHGNGATVRMNASDYAVFSRMFCVRTMNESVTTSDRITADAIAAASRAPA